MPLRALLSKSAYDALKCKFLNSVYLSWNMAHEDIFIIANLQSESLGSGTCDVVQCVTISSLG